MTDIYGKGPKGKATRLHALIIRSHGFCESCGSGHQLQCAHIISRKYSNTRTSLDNAFCLCASCHRTFTDNPVDFGQFVTDMMGEERYRELVMRRNLISKVDWDAEATRLTEIAREKGLI